MLDPRYLDTLPDPIVALFQQAEDEIIADMARKIAAYDYWMPAAEWQNQKLREAGVVQEDILRALSGVTGKSEAELRRMMQEAGSMALKTDAAIYENAGLSVPDIAASEPLKKVLNAGYAATSGTMQNLCRSTATAGQQQFLNAVDLAWMKVQSGAFDVNSAIREALKGLASHGIAAVSYPSGHVDYMDVAVRCAVVTGVNQTACKLSEELADELDCDLVEVPAHAGARPEHAVWQGRIYSRSGKDPKYPDFRSATGYGTGAGLGGWNCHHTFGPYVEGSPPIWSDEELEKLNAKAYEYNGRKLTEYEASQMQRYNERQIRRWKREYVVAEATEQDTAKAASKIKKWQAAQRDFLEQTGLKRQYDREHTVVFGHAQASVAAAEANRIEKAANSIFSLGGTDENVKAYLKEKTVIDMLSQHGVKYIQRISASEIIVDAGKPTISRYTKHALENLQNKPDRSAMTIERAQEFVDNATLSIFRQSNESLKFLAQDGYAVLSFAHELMTAVPQKWRKKYDKYLEGK